MPNRIFFFLLGYNEYSYLQPVLHLYACMYMGFVPENNLIHSMHNNVLKVHIKTLICS